MVQILYPFGHTSLHSPQPVHLSLSTSIFKIRTPQVSNIIILIYLLIISIIFYVYYIFNIFENYYCFNSVFKDLSIKFFKVLSIKYYYNFKVAIETALKPR